LKLNVTIVTKFFTTPKSEKKIHQNKD